MFKLFYPCEYVESVFTIDYEKLYNKPELFMEQY